MKKALHFINKQALLWCLFLISGIVWGQVDIDNQPFTNGSLPSGWTQSSITFETSAGGYANFTASSSTLTSPVYNLSAFSDVKLSFSVAKFGSGSDGPVTIQVSNNGGSTWTAQTFNSGTPTSGTYVNTADQAINVTGSSVRIRIIRTASVSAKRFRNYVLSGTMASAVAPVVTGGTINATVGVNSSNQISATSNPTSYAVATGSLPTGLSLNTTSGIISGIPTTAGNSSVTVTAQNGTGTSDPTALNFVVAKGAQTITFGALASKEYGDTFNLTATSTTSTPITYVSSNTSVATISGNTVTIVGVGSTIIKASQAGTANYNAATDVDQSLSITKRNLTISGLTGANKTYDASTTATASGTEILNGVLPADAANVLLSGTPTYNFASATVGIDKTITATGFALSGNASGNYNLTQPAGITATIFAKTLMATGVVAQNKVYDATTIATINGGTLTGVEASDTVNVALATTGFFASANAGSGIAVTVTLTGSAASNYSLIQPGLTANITKASQTITFNALPTLNIGSSPVNLSTYASTTSALAIIYESSNTNVVSVSGNTLTVVGIGTAVITASQAGDSNYNAAVTATQNVTVSLVPIVIAQFDFDSYTASIAPQVTTKNNNVSVTDFAVSSGTLAIGQITGSNFPNEPFVAGNGDWTAITQATAKNFNFNVTANQGYAIEVTSFQFNALATAAGPSAMSFNIASGLSSFTANAPDGSLVTLNQTISGVNNLTTIPVLIQGWLNGSRTSSGAGVFRIDDVILKGYVTCIKPTAFTISGGGAICGTETRTINLASSELGMNYQLKINGSDSGSPLAGTGSTLDFTSQSTIGTYTIVATNQYCSASTTMTGSASITAGICNTTWTIVTPPTTTGWTNGAPTASIDAIIDADYNETANITTKNLTINTDKVLTIQPANTLTVAGNLTNNGSIVFKSDATGTATFASYTGAAIAGSGTSTVERYIPAKRAWRLLTAPLKGNVSSISSNWQGTNGEGLLLFSPASLSYTGYVTGGTLPNIRKYNGGYQDITNLTTEPLFGAAGTDTKSFLVFATGPVGSPNIVTGATATTLKATGQLITGDVNHASLVVNTFHLLSNPYASSINPVSLIANNPTQKLWLIEPSLGTFGAYVTYDGQNWSIPTPTGTDALIQSGQGFFTRSAAATTFSINESNKAAGSSNTWFAKNADAVSTVENADKIRVLLYKQIDNNWKLADAILSVNYYEGSNDVNAMDSNKISNFNESIMFRNNTTNLSIEHRALPLSTEIQPLRLTGTSVLQYQLRVYTENYTNSLLIPVLEDTLNGTFTEIPMDGSVITIPFTGVVSSSTNPDNRFQIVYQTNLSTVGTSKLVASVFPNPVTNNQLNVNLGTNTIPADYTITNLLGQAIQKGKLANTQNVIQLSASQGFYILNITQEGKTFTTKIYVQ